ncbi:MAG: DUF1573 domain-containing protein [Pirellulales bacterium]
MFSGYVRSLALGVLAVACCLVASEQASAQNWVSKMFADKEHNFGTVARGADTVYKFPVKNIYKQDIELVSVRSSCGCTSPTLEHKLIKTGETGYVVAKFNTRTFDGVHSATLTVDVQWNDNGITRSGETQLRVHGDIRSDVVFEPGAIKFDSVDQGNKSEQQVQVRYAGRSDWKITDVRGASDDLEVELTETGRQSGRVTYDLLVRLKDGAPAGYFNEQLVLVTNDGNNPRIPLHVEGRVMPQISVAPEALRFGDVASGATIPMKVLVRGKKPFKITSVQSPSGQFEFKTDEESSPRHVIEVVFAGSEQPGQIKEPIHITTDLGETYDATVTAYATVLAPAAAQPAENQVAPATGDVTSDGAVPASGEQVAAQ